MQERPRGVPNALRESRKVWDWPKGKLMSLHLSVGIIFIDWEIFCFKEFMFKYVLQIEIYNTLINTSFRCPAEQWTQLKIKSVLIK